MPRPWPPRLSEDDARPPPPPAPGPFSAPTPPARAAGQRVYQPTLSLDWPAVNVLELDAAQTALVAEMAPVLDGKPDVTRVDRIELERLAEEMRLQRLIFEAARDVFDLVRPAWPGNREALLAQLVAIADRFIQSDRLTVTPSVYGQDPLRRRLIITLNMTRVVQHLWEAIRFDNTERLVPVFDRDNPIRSTGDMSTWYTGKPCERTRRSHINVCVYDSAWEASDAFALDQSNHVAAWAKNDHLGFEVFYVYRGVVRKYRPDFLIRLAGGDMLVLETKGQETERDRVKWRYRDEWTKAVTEHGGFGCWSWVATMRPGESRDVIASLG